MKIDCPTYISYPIVTAVVGPMLLSIPFLSVLGMMLIGALPEIFDCLIADTSGDFLGKSDHVDVGFLWLWMSLDTLSAWMFYSGVFLFFGFLIGLIKHVLKTRGEKFYFGQWAMVVCIVSYVIPLVILSLIYSTT